jgi:hypothetical protein
MSVPAPACPLKTAGPLCVPVNVTTRQGAARAVDTLGAAATVKTNANATNSVLVMIILQPHRKLASSAIVAIHYTSVIGLGSRVGNDDQL